MTRRTVVWSPLLLGLRHARAFLSNRVTETPAGDAEAQGSSTTREPDRIVLENRNHKLEFDPKSARLLSFRAHAALEQEFVISGDQIPVFVIQYLTEDREFRQIASTAARDVSVETKDGTLTAFSRSLGNWSWPRLSPSASATTAIH